MSISQIQDILEKNMKSKSGLAKQIQASLVCEEFDKIVQNKWGSKIKNKAKALYFKDNILTIASLSSVMAQEIKLHETEILDQLNTKFQPKAGPPRADNNTIQRIRYLI